MRFLCCSTVCFKLVYQVVSASRRVLLSQPGAWKHTMVRRRFWCKRTDNQLSPFCVHSPAAPMSKHHSTLKRGAHLNNMMQPSNPFGPAAAACDSGLLQGDDICLLFPQSFLQNRQLARPLEPHVPAGRRREHTCANRFKSTGFRDVLRFVISTPTVTYRCCVRTVSHQFPILHSRK